MDYPDTTIDDTITTFLPNTTISTENQNGTNISEATTTTATVFETPFYLNFRDEPWVIPLVSLSLFNIAVIVIFEIYVLYKSCGGRRHLFLGQILLLGLFLCSVLGLLYVPQPHKLFCSITRAGLGIAYAIVFGSLLVKCVFLLKLHGGVYFNASFQGLFLFFVVAVEIVLELFNYRRKRRISFSLRLPMKKQISLVPLSKQASVMYIEVIHLRPFAEIAFLHHLRH